MKRTIFVAPLANALNGLAKVTFTTLNLLIQTGMNFLVPSSSAQAALTMPVMAALGICKIPFQKWLKVVLPLVLVLWVVAAVFLFVGLKIYPVI